MFQDDFHTSIKLTYRKAHAFSESTCKALARGSFQIHKGRSQALLDANCVFFGEVSLLF